MEIEIEEKRRKSKVVGIRLYKEECDLISEIAKKKKASRSLRNRQFALRWAH